MKLSPILFLALMTTTMTSFNLSAQNNVNYEYQGIDNSLNTRICVAAVNNNLPALKILSRLDQYGMRDISENLTCNNQDITNFAAKNGARKTTKYLSLHAPKKYKVNVEDVQIQDLANVQDKKIQFIYIASK